MDKNKVIWRQNKYKFSREKMLKENESYKCLSLIMLESVIKGKNKKYYPQTLLEECKYEIKRTK